MVNAAAGAVGSVVGQIAKLKVSVCLRNQHHSTPRVCAGSAAVHAADLPSRRGFGLLDLL